MLSIFSDDKKDTLIKRIPIRCIDFFFTGDEVNGPDNMSQDVRLLNRFITSSLHAI